MLDAKLRQIEIRRPTLQGTTTSDTKMTENIYERYKQKGKLNIEEQKYGDV